MPAQLSFQAAASLPIAYLTAYYALNEQARLRRGERVLIHSAAGGVGLAAVEVALWLGATVYATTSTRRSETTWMRSASSTSRTHVPSRSPMRY